MCGVVGYTGKMDAVPVIIYGLSKLEYRGYDSAGVAVFNNDNISIEKAKGKLSNLEAKLVENPLKGNLGIGHTRWATHGAPSDINSHPQSSSKNNIAVVHNGIIENYMDLKEELIDKGYTFKSDTDTETVANLIDYYYNEDKDLKSSVLKTLERINGSYALGVVCEDYKDTIIAARKDCPLIIGLAKGENFIASDVTAILNYTRDVYILDDYEVAEVTPNSVKVFDLKGNTIEKELTHIDWDVSQAERGGYPHFMLKEINEQAKVVRDTLSPRLKNSHIELNVDITKYNKIYMVACGTAYYSTLIGKSLIEKFCRIPVVCEIASEFRYNNPIVDENTLVIVVSQSGETADTLAALKLARQKGAFILSVVNVVGSSITRESHEVLYTLAGPEISVASTKAFSTQVAAMYLISIGFAMKLGKLTKDEYIILKDEMERLPSLIEIVLTKSNLVKDLAHKYKDVKNAFYIGRGMDYVMGLEGSLKLKEIAYIHSECYAAGELKHGPIAMLEEDTLIVAVATNAALLEKTISNIRECKARGAKVLCIAMEGTKYVSEICDDVVYIPPTKDIFAPVLANIVQQFFAYFMADLLGNDVDKPRNLAKSVTVE